MTTVISNTEINGARITNVFNGSIQLDFINRENGFQVWSHSFSTNEINELASADKTQGSIEDRIKAIYNLISIQVDNYISEWEFENE